MGLGKRMMISPICFELTNNPNQLRAKYLTFCSTERAKQKLVLSELNRAFDRHAAFSQSRVDERFGQIHRFRRQ